MKRSSFLYKSSVWQVRCLTAWSATSLTVSVRPTAGTAVSVTRDRASREFVTLATLRTDTDSYVWDLRVCAPTSPVLLAPRPFQRWMFPPRRRGQRESAVKPDGPYNGRVPDEGVNESFIEQCSASGKWKDTLGAHGRGGGAVPHRALTDSHRCSFSCSETENPSTDEITYLVLISPFLEVVAVSAANFRNKVYLFFTLTLPLLPTAAIVARKPITKLSVAWLFDSAAPVAEITDSSLKCLKRLIEIRLPAVGFLDSHLQTQPWWVNVTWIWTYTWISMKMKSFLFEKAATFQV